MTDEGQRLSGPAIGSIAVGGLLVFAGIKGYSLSQTIQFVIQGKSPLTQTQANPIADQAPTDATGSYGTGAAPGAPGSTGSTGPGTGSAIATQAQTYIGKLGYCYGGAMAGAVNGCPAGQPDCSSFVNWVVGHDMGMAIPGYAAGTYTGAVHGPATGSWALFGTSISQAEVQAGDIVIWGPSVHMGIATSSTEYISDHDPQEGVNVSSISGSGNLGILFCRRIVG